MQNKIIKFFLGLILFVGFSLYLTFFIVQETEQAIVLQLGQL